MERRLGGQWGYGGPCSLLEMQSKLKSQGKSIKASGDSNKQLVKANWKYEVSKDSRFQWNIHLLYQPNVCKSSVLPIPKRPPFLGMAKWHLSSQLWVHMLLQVLLEPALLDLRRIFRIGGFHVSHKKSPLTFHYLSLSLSSAVNPCPSPLSIRIYIYNDIYSYCIYKNTGCLTRILTTV